VHGGRHCFVTSEKGHERVGEQGSEIGDSLGKDETEEACCSGGSLSCLTKETDVVGFANYSCSREFDCPESLAMNVGMTSFVDVR